MRQCFLRNEEKSLLCEREFNVRIHAPKMTAIPTVFALKRTRRRHCFFVFVFIVCAAAFFVSTPVSADVSLTDPGEDSDDFGVQQQQEQFTRGRLIRRLTSTRDDENEEDDFAAVSSSSVSSNHESSSSSKSSKVKFLIFSL